MDNPTDKNAMATVSSVIMFKYTGSDLTAKDTICNPNEITAKILAKNTLLSGVSEGEM